MFACEEIADTALYEEHMVYLSLRITECDYVLREGDLHWFPNTTQQGTDCFCVVFFATVTIERSYVRLDLPHAARLLSAKRFFELIAIGNKQFEVRQGLVVENGHALRTTQFTEPSTTW